MKTKIIVAATSKTHFDLNGVPIIPSVKDYPYMREFLKLIQDYDSDLELVQLLESDDNSDAICDTAITTTIEEIEVELASATAFITNDSYLQHLAQIIDVKGYVFWGPTDHKYEGYRNNINIFKEVAGYDYPHGFNINWSTMIANDDLFVSIDEAFDIFIKTINKVREYNE